MAFQNETVAADPRARLTSGQCATEKVEPLGATPHATRFYKRNRAAAGTWSLRQHIGTRNKLAS